MSDGKTSEKADTDKAGTVTSAIGSLAYDSFVDYNCTDDSKYGFDDPYHTGQALAVFGVLYPFVGGCISVTPDFEHQVLKGSAYLKGKIYLWHFVQSGWKLIWNRNVRQTYRDIRNLKIK